MSALLGRTPAPATAGGPAPPLDAGTARSMTAAPTDSLQMRLVAFAALGAFAAAHWNSLVENPPAGRMLLVLLVATAGGAVLALLGRAPLPRAAVHASAALVGIAMLALGLMAAGLPGRLLLPAHWGALADGLDRGLAGVQSVDWPYGGPELWIRRTVLLGAPALLTIGALLTFWPARRGTAALRFGGLVAVLLLYGTAVAEHDPGQPALRGLILLVLVGAWLWLPRLPRGEAGVAAAVVASVGVLSLPVAAAFDSDRAWWDYRAWDWFGTGKVLTFDWNHTYGPLDWSRAGETVLYVKSARPQYWKAETLDGFDGFRWARLGDLADIRYGYGTQVAFSVPRAQGHWEYNEYNPEWDERIRFTVRSLSTPFVVGAGVILKVDGARARLTSDGTMRLLGDRRLEEGDSYSVRAYAPNPTRQQMQRVPAGFSSSLLRYTGITLPRPGESATDELTGPAFVQREVARRETIAVPLRGDVDQARLGPHADRALRSSPYRPMYEQALRLTSNTPTTYDAVKRVERWLQNNFTYSERVPSHSVPLMGFLEEDKRGYCQQFSGTMALMLRMAGIPARVAAGFAPGSYNKDTREYRVRDLDAHSWVEVWFTGIGWVPFDPTPARSPAQSQSSALATSAAAADAGEVRAQIPDVTGSKASEGGSAFGDEGGQGWVLPALILLLVAAPLAAAGVVLGRRVTHLRHLAPDAVAEAQLFELRRALVRLGWDLPASTTLLGLERRLGRFAGPASEAYAGALRANRYDPRQPSAPSLRQRRALRRELTRGSVFERVKGLVAIPPGAPRA
jgi:transglutaminase-like putative cysteine protease